MTVTLSNVITVRDPNTDVKKYCKQGLTIDNPEYEKKQRLGFWVGDTPKKICLYSVKGEDYILPYGTMLDVKSLTGNCEWTADFPTAEKVDYNCNIPLYDYQKTAVEVMQDNCFGILKAPAGSGKTQMGIALIAKQGRRALWITHTQDLLKQSYSRAKQYIAEDMLGTITEGKINIGTGITFATIQTLARIDLTDYADFWDVVVVDECHRCSGSPTVITQFSKVLNQLKARHKYGLSATVHRADGTIKCTYALLGEIKHSVPDSAVGDRIVQVGIKGIPTNIGMSEECLNEDGTLNYSALITYLTENRRRNKLLIDYLQDNSRYSCLILSERLSHLETLFNSLPDEMKSKAVMISGRMQTKTGKAAREKAIEEMRTGEKKYLFATYSLAKEGLDIPRLERLFMATPVKDYAVVVQSVGRIARAFDGKAEPICYDFVDRIPYLIKAYRKRWTSYKKCNCYEVE